MYYSHCTHKKWSLNIAHTFKSKKTLCVHFSDARIGLKLVFCVYFRHCTHKKWSPNLVHPFRSKITLCVHFSDARTLCVHRALHAPLCVYFSDIHSWVLNMNIKPRNTDFVYLEENNFQLFFVGQTKHIVKPRHCYTYALLSQRHNTILSRSTFFLTLKANL